jgi:hypothetical protein
MGVEVIPTTGNLFLHLAQSMRSHETIKWRIRCCSFLGFASLATSTFNRPSVCDDNFLTRILSILEARTKFSDVSCKRRHADSWSVPDLKGGRKTSITDFFSLSGPRYRAKERGREIEFSVPFHVQWQSPNGNSTAGLKWQLQCLYYRYTNTGRTRWTCGVCDEAELSWLKPRGSCLPWR